MAYAFDVETLDTFFTTFEWRRLLAEYVCCYARGKRHLISLVESSSSCLAICKTIGQSDCIPGHPEHVTWPKFWWPASTANQFSFSHFTQRLAIWNYKSRGVAAEKTPLVSSGGGRTCDYATTCIMSRACTYGLVLAYILVMLHMPRA